MKYLDKCPICNNKALKMLYQGLKDKVFEQNQEQFSIIRCQHCGITFTNPQIEIDEYNRYYLTDKYIPYLPHKFKKYQRTLKLIHDALSKVFINKMKGVINPGYKILEIGCASGDFLLKCKKRGMEVWGVEIDKNAAQRAINNGLNVLAMSFEDAFDHLKEYKFDIIFMSHVFEHIQSPQQVLTYLNYLLNTDGRIIMLIPNIRSLTHYIFKQDFMHLDVPRHFFHYSPQSISYLAKIAGLYVDQVRYVSGPVAFLNSMVQKLKIKDYYPANSYFLRIILLLLIVILNRSHFGDEISVLLRKKL